MMPDRLATKARDVAHIVGLFLRALAVVIVLAPTIVWAHGLSAFAHAEGDTVVVEGYFHDGAKCKDCMVEAFDAQGHRIADGKTDADGKFSFKAPARINMLIRLNDPVGHMAEYRIPASDLPESLPAASESIQDHTHAPDTDNAAMVSGTLKTRDAGEVERMIEKAVARQLEPIRRALEESQRRRKITDVVGGIGYIVGLMGLILYFRSKQRQ
jgi:nickel transport protein